jgi:hypothetical protein
VATTPSPPRESRDLPPILPPLRFPTSSPSDDVLSLSSRVTRLSFGSPFSPDSQFDSISTSGSVLDPGWNFSSPVYQRAQLPFSISSSDSSVIDPFPSSASVEPIPSIPSISSDFQLNNLPTLPPSVPLFEPRAYSYFTAGDAPISSFFETLPVISTAPSLDSFTESLASFIPSAQQAHQDMLTAPNPLATNRRAGVIIRDRSYMTDSDDTRQGSGRHPWTYTYKTLPYEAGLRPHAYVDNSETPLGGKRGFGVNGHRGITGGVGKRASDEGKDSKKPPPPSKLKKLIRGSSISRLLNFHVTRKKLLREEKENMPVPASSSPKERPNFTSPGQERRVTPTSLHRGSDDGTATAKASPSTPKPGARGSKRFSLPRHLSLFVVPKPRMNLVESPTIRPEDSPPLDERLQALRSSARPNAGFSSVERTGEARVGASQASVSPPMKVKNRRRKSWFNLSSPNVGPALRRFSR